MPPNTWDIETIAESENSWAYDNVRSGRIASVPVLTRVRNGPRLFYALEA